MLKSRAHKINILSKALHASIFCLAFLFSTSQAFADASIFVTKATWGGKDVTSLAYAFCFHSADNHCYYKVSETFLGQPHQSPADFSIDWLCPSSGRSFNYTVPAPADGTKFTIECPSLTQNLNHSNINNSYNSSSSSSNITNSTPSTSTTPIPSSSNSQATISPIQKTVSASNVSSRIGSWNPRSPLDYPTSFHTLIRPQSPFGPVKSGVNDTCLRALNKHLDMGGDFYSENIVNYSVAVKDFPRADVQDLHFYHYTNSRDAYNNAMNQNFEAIFSYLRNLPTSYHWYLYISADKESSSEYGNLGVDFELSPYALIFMNHEGVASNSAPDRINEIRNQIESELIQKDSQLSVCRNVDVGDDMRSNSILVRLALEASRISAIAYFGFSNNYSGNLCKGCDHIQWLEVVGPWALKRATNAN